MPSVASSPRRKRLRLSLLRLAARALSSIVARPGAARPRRVLLVRPDHIGDVLLSAPAVALLKMSLPDAHLTYLVGPWSAAAARQGPPVEAVHELAYPGFTRRRNTNLLAPYLILLQAANELRRQHFDAAVVLRPDHWWGALLALAAGIPTRIGTSTPETTPFLTDAYTNRGEHAAEHAIGVARLALRAFGATPCECHSVTQFALGDRAAMVAEELWREHHLAGKVVVGIHPSAGAPLKSWPVERWATLADALACDGLAVVLIGAPDDAALLAAISDRAPRFCGQSLEVSAALYARCSVVVTVDSGAGHLAAAVGAPTVRLYGPAPLAVFGPYPPREDQRVLLTDALSCVPCVALESPPCGAHSAPACLLALGVDDVLKAVRAQLSRG